MPFHIQSRAWILDLSQGSSTPYNLNRRQFNDTPHQPNKKKKKVYVIVLYSGLMKMKTKKMLFDA